MVRKKDDSLFDMFQDPIMTMIALILLSTLSMIIPSESKEKSPEFFERKESIDSLLSSINVYDKEINMLEIQIGRIRRELDWIREKADNQIDTQSTAVDSVNGDIIYSINELQEKIQRGKDELNRLEGMIANARKKADHSPGGESIRSLFQEIDATQGILDKKMKQLISIENQRIEAQKKEKERKANVGSLQSHHDQLLNEIGLKKDKREQLEKELVTLQKNDLPNDEMNSPEGYTEIRSTSKSVFYFHLRNGKVLPVDDDHYSIQNGQIQMKNGKVVSAVKQSPFASAKWESINVIENDSSVYVKAIDKLNSQKSCIVFLVDTCSFQVFRKARDIARRKKFEVGWEPFTESSILCVSRSDAGKINVEKQD